MSSNFGRTITLFSGTIGSLGVGFLLVGTFSSFGSRRELWSLDRLCHVEGHAFAQGSHDFFGCEFFHFFPEGSTSYVVDLRNLREFLQDQVSRPVSIQECCDFTVLSELDDCLRDLGAV